MIFRISNIIENQNLKVRLLTYEQCSVKTLDLSILTEKELIRFNRFGSDKRKKEFFFTRLLWNNFEERQVISYAGSGKPHIENGHISISHSSNSIAISYSDNKLIGLDIEHFSPKIGRVKHKFLSPEERAAFNLNDEKIITTLWSIKEAVYKLLDIDGLSFKECIRILEIGELNRVQIKTPELNTELTFTRLVFDTFILTYCLYD